MVAWHEVPGIRKKRSPSRRDGVIMYSGVRLQRSCWHVLSSVMESRAAPTQSSCPSGTDRFLLRPSRHFVPGYSHESLRDNKSPGDNNQVSAYGIYPRVCLTRGRGGSPSRPRDAPRKDGRLGDPALPSLTSNSLSFKWFYHQFLEILLRNACERVR
jgi:hypothetical protein